MKNIKFTLIIIMVLVVFGSLAIWPVGVANAGPIPIPQIPLIITAPFPPDMMNISGVLVDSISKPYTGLVDLKFDIYKGGDSNTGGTIVWSNTYNSVALDSKGYFNVPIGGADASSRPFPIFENSEIFTGTAFYVRISVHQGAAPLWTVLNPRQRLVTVPYAFQARYASLLSSESGSISGPNDFVKKSGDNMTGQFSVGRSAGRYFDVQFKSLGTANGGTNCNLVLESNGGRGWLLSAADDGKLKFDTITYNGDSASWGTFGKLTIDTAGNVGLGASSPIGKLHVNGAGSAVDLVLTDAASTKGWSLREYNGDLNFLVKLANSNVLYSGGPVFKPDGRVGIGTSEPAAKLEVNGGAVKFPGGTAGNPTGLHTWFNYAGDGRNYIRGNTVVQGDLTVSGNINGNMSFKNLSVDAASGVAVYAHSPNDTAIWAETDNAAGTAIDARNNAGGTALSISGAIHMDREYQEASWVFDLWYQPKGGQTFTFTTSAPIISIRANVTPAMVANFGFACPVICPVVKPYSIFLPIYGGSNYSITNVADGSFTFTPGLTNTTYTFLIIN